MTVFWTFLACVISLTGLGYFVVTDAKRRRTHGQQALARRPYVPAARFLIFAPGALLMFDANWSGLAIWAGVVTVLGWGISAVSPSGYATTFGNARTHIGKLAQTVDKQLHELSRFSKTTGTQLRNGLSSIGQNLQKSSEIERLEAKIDALENRIRALEGRGETDPEDND